MSEEKAGYCDDSDNFTIDKMHVLPQPPILSFFFYILPQKNAYPAAFIRYAL